MTALAPAVESFFTDYPEAVIIPMSNVGLPPVARSRPVGSG